MVKVTIPASTPAGLWNVTRKVLEAIEPGASNHCLRVTWKGDSMVGYEHVRLGITFTLED